MKTIAFMIASCLVAFPAAAQAPREDDQKPRRDPAEIVRDGTFNPQTLSARIGDHRVAAMIQGGYDTTAPGGTVNAFIEGALYRRVALRVGINSLVATGAADSRNVYSIGLRVGLTRQELHGIDLGISATYKSTGLVETKGELEIGLLLSRRFHRTALYSNLVYGQGFVSSERHAEIRLGGLYAIDNRFNIGVDGSGRFDLGNGDPNHIKPPDEVDFELLVGPVATVALGRAVLLAQAGSHTVMIDQTNKLSTGLAATLGLGTAF